MANISEFDIKVIKTELGKRSQADNFFGDVCHSAIGYIDNLEKAIAEKQKRIENMEKIIEDQQERIDIMSEGGWISVKDRLPEQRIGVLVYCPEYNNVFAGELNDYLKKGQWYFFDDEIKHPIKEEVTHWMPMPQPPEEGEQE